MRAAQGVVSGVCLRAAIQTDGDDGGTVQGLQGGVGVGGQDADAEEIECGRVGDVRYKADYSRDCEDQTNKFQGAGLSGQRKRLVHKRDEREQRARE